MKKKIVILIVITLFSCQSSLRKNDIKQIVQEWQGKEIQIPLGKIEYKVMGRDTSCVELWSKPYKIFTYVDSVGCTSCQLGLSQWKRLIDSCVILSSDVSFIFVVNSSDFESFENFVFAYDFNYPIIYDRHNEFELLNNFPQKPYRTFLLDKNNKVILVGSPTDYPEIWNLYLQQIKNEKHN